MKIFKLIYVSVLIVGLSPLLVLAADLTPVEISDRADEVLLSDTSYLLADMTIETTLGDKRTMRTESYSLDGGDKTYMVYLSPSRVKGTAFLMAGDAIWTYFPSTERVRRLASHMKNSNIMGSDFSFDDMMGSSRRSDDYDVSLRKEDRSFYYLELIPKVGSDSGYSKIVGKIRKRDFMTLEVDYYDENGKHLKTLTMSGFKEMGGRLIPTGMVMENVQTTHRTSFQIRKAEFDIEIPDKYFTVNYLKRGR